MCFLKLRGILFFVSRETNKHETDAVSDMDFNPGILKVRVLSRERRQKMSKIQKINKQTENRFLNLYDLEAKDRMGGDIHYYVSSRAKTPNDLKINTRNEKPDGVIIYSLYGYASGQISREGLEDTEDLEVVLADREEVRRILKEERVAIMCAYMLMHFLKEEPFGFLQL